jgi:hypothetical protein
VEDGAAADPNVGILAGARPWLVQIRRTIQAARLFLGKINPRADISAIARTGTSRGGGKCRQDSAKWTSAASSRPPCASGTDGVERFNPIGGPAINRH